MVKDWDNLKQSQEIKKVFILEKNDGLPYPEDYFNEGIFSTKELAEEFLEKSAKFNFENDVDILDEGQTFEEYKNRYFITERELDPKQENEV